MFQLGFGFFTFSFGVVLIVFVVGGAVVVVSGVVDVVGGVVDVVGGAVVVVGGVGIDVVVLRDVVVVVGGRCVAGFLPDGMLLPFSSLFPPLLGWSLSSLSGISQGGTTRGFS